MKKSILFTLVFALVSINSFAAEPIETQSIDQELKKLDKIENYVTANANTSLEDLKNSNVLDGITLAETSTISAAASGDLPANIPPFLWGCVLGVIGILLVYILTDNDKALTKKAVIGCLVGWGAGLIIYFVLVAGVFGAAATAI